METVAANGDLLPCRHRAWLVRQFHLVRHSIRDPAILTPLVAVRVGVVDPRHGPRADRPRVRHAAVGGQPGPAAQARAVAQAAAVPGLPAAASRGGGTLEGRDLSQIRSEAASVGATIYFTEAPRWLGRPRRTTWAPVGHTPVVTTTGDRFGINLISAVTAKGRIRFAAYDGSLNGPVFIDFCRGLLYEAPARCSWCWMAIRCTAPRP